MKYVEGKYELEDGEADAAALTAVAMMKALVSLYQVDPTTTALAIAIVFKEIDRVAPDFVDFALDAARLSVDLDRHYRGKTRT